MPKMKPEQYAAQKEALLTLAARPEGVTVAEVIESIKNGENSISRPRAEKLIKENNLPVIKREGRTQHFGSPGATGLPPVAKKTTKKGTSPEARLTKLNARSEKLTRDVEKLTADVAAVKAEILTASVIEVVPNEAPAAETAPAVTN